MEQGTTIQFEQHGVSRKVSVPTGWNDLGLRDLLLVYNAIFQAPGTGAVLQRFTTMKIISIAKHLLALDDDFMQQWKMDCITNDPEDGEMIFLEEVKAVVDAAISGLFNVEEEDGVVYYSAKMNLTKNPYPEIVLEEERNGRTTVTWFYGPSDGLGNVTIYELGYSFTLFEQFLQTGNEQLVNELLAVLYRPSRPRTKADAENAWGGDRRVKIRGYEAKAEQRAEVMGTTNIQVKRILLFWFASCRDAIIARFPNVFKRKSQDDSDATQYGWAGVLLGLAGGPAHLNAVSDQHYSNALVWLDMQSSQ